MKLYQVPSFSRIVLNLMYSRKFAPFTALLQFTLDSLTWTFTAAVASYIRFVYQRHNDPMVATQESVLRVIPVVFVVHALVGLIVGIYRRRWRYGSFDEIGGLVITGTVTTVILLALRFFDRSIDAFPRSVIVGAGFAALCLVGANRYVWRLVRQQVQKPTALSATKLLVYGAGEGGIQIVNTMLRNPSSKYLPVGFIDDNPQTHRLSISGVPVLGDFNSLKSAKLKTGATSILIAIPSADSDLIRKISDQSAQLKLEVKIVPPVQNLFDRPLTTGDIHDLTEEDLLGRRHVDIDLQQISDYVTNRRVLVTGAGGSIGSELCRQLFRFNPSELTMLDRDESALHELQLSIHGRALLDTPQTVLADIRDSETIERIFAERKPEIVFHAAALKHLPLLEGYPNEAYQTNILGTLALLKASKNVGVSVFVNISTDKAANPISVLGYSKRVAERLTASFGNSTSRYLSVRFGNVLGSRGSVLVSFRDQISKGGPITLTHRNVTRYFMTISEAVQLVIQAGAIGKNQSVLVLDMGKPVSIFDVATQLIRSSNRPIDIEIVGLRPGEKVDEELFGEGEVDSRDQHPLISEVSVEPLSDSLVLAKHSDAKALMRELLGL